MMLNAYTMMIEATTFDAPITGVIYPDNNRRGGIRLQLFPSDLELARQAGVLEAYGEGHIEQLASEATGFTHPKAAASMLVLPMIRVALSLKPISAGG